AELDATCERQDLEGACYRVVRRLAAAHGEEIERRYPKILRRVGGYNLDLFTQTSPFSRAPRASAEPALARGARLDSFNLAHLLVGSEGTLAVTLEAKLRLIELPKAKAV